MTKMLVKNNCHKCKAHRVSLKKLDYNHKMSLKYFKSEDYNHIRQKLYKRTMSTSSWTPWNNISPSNLTIFFLFAALSVPTNASNKLAHLSSLNRTPNFTVFFPSTVLKTIILLDYIK